MRRLIKRAAGTFFFLGLFTAIHPTVPFAENSGTVPVRQVESVIWLAPGAAPLPFVQEGYDQHFWGEIPDYDLIKLAGFNEETLGEIPGVDPIVVGAIGANSEVKKYCINILDEAKEARHALLAERLADMQASADLKLDELDERIAVLKNWMQKREQFLANAKDSLVQIFQTMRPDSAAQQLTEMDTVLSAAIIAKLEPKYSSAILAEMAPEDAAKIAMMLTHAVSLDD